MSKKRKSDLKKMRWVDLESDNELCQDIIATAHNEGVEVYRIQNIDIECWQLKKGDEIVRIYPVHKKPKKIAPEEIMKGEEN